MFRGPNFQVFYIFYEYFPIYPISKVHCHFSRKKAINNGRSRRRGFTHPVFLLGPYLMSFAAKKIKMTSLMILRFLQVLIASDSTLGNGSNYNTRCILPLHIIPSKFGSPLSLRPRNDFQKIGVGYFLTLWVGCFLIKLEVVVLGFWGSKFKLPSTRPTTC